MNFQHTQQILKCILAPFKSASLVTDEGKLLASQDKQTLKSTTSRLVVFQIFKKYLNPQKEDLFILNDPENGGLNYQNVFFITRLTDKIFLIFVQELPLIDFKIPPTPLYDNGIKNKTVWPFLVDQHPFAEELKTFFESVWDQVHELKNLTPYLAEISLAKNQALYFKIVLQIFERFFNGKALGQNEVSVMLGAQNLIKLKLTIDEKQNQRTIHADFSQSSLAQKISAASHVVESSLIMAIADCYHMTDLLSQPVLDHIRLTLPPRSIVAKAHPQGAYNLLLQKVVNEKTIYLLRGLTKAKKAPQEEFKLSPEFHIDLQINGNNYPIVANAKKMDFKSLDYLIQSQKLFPLISQVVDGKIHLQFKIHTTEKAVLIPRLILPSYNQPFLTVGEISLNNQVETVLKTNDVVDIQWPLLK